MKEERLTSLIVSYNALIIGLLLESKIASVIMITLAVIAIINYIIIVNK